MTKKQDFESGCGSDERCGSAQGSRGAGPSGASRGSYAIQGTYSKDSDDVSWVYNGYEGNFSELYVSWYDYTESKALFNDEYFLTRIWKEDANGGLTMEVVTQFMFSGINAHDGELQEMSQGVSQSSNTIDQFGSYRITYPVGQWVQWEVHYRPNTFTGGKPNADGFYRIYMNGILKRSFENIVINGTQSMGSAFIGIGGVYTKLVWTYKDPNVVGSSACNVPSQCAPSGNLDGCRNYMGWTVTFANPQCGPSLPSFKRYIDDIIVMKK